MTDSCTVVFKKRSIKSANARKKDLDSGDNNEEPQINGDVLMDIKLQQTIRQRKSGASTDVLSKSYKEKTTEETVSDEPRTIESVMGTQYTTQMDYGIQNNSVPHKKLMDQYIAEKMGESKPAKQEVKVATDEDELYRIPDFIKVDGKEIKQSNSSTSSGNAADNIDNGIVPAWSTQLAEVALPISFKLKNIEETERAAAIAAGKINPVSTQVQFRFNSHERAPKLHPSMEGFVENTTTTSTSTTIEGNTNSVNKRPLKSSDDRALEQYKKRQMNHRR